MTTEAVDGMLRPEYREVKIIRDITFVGYKLTIFLSTLLKIVLGQEKMRVTKCDQELINEFIALGKECENTDGIKKTMGGKTMCANDFYEGMYINSMRFYETIFYCFLFDIRYSKRARKNRRSILRVYC